MCCAGGFHMFSMFVLCLCVCEAKWLGTLRSNKVMETISIPKKLCSACAKLLFNLLKKLFFFFLTFLPWSCRWIIISPYCHGWQKLSKLTNHRVYQELVYRNDVLKTMLTGFTYPSLGQLPRGFRAIIFYVLSPLSWILEQHVVLPFTKKKVHILYQYLNNS